MIVHDTEYPYIYQVSLNNTKLIKFFVFFAYILFCFFIQAVGVMPQSRRR